MIVGVLARVSIRDRLDQTWKSATAVTHSTKSLVLQSPAMVR